jgi:hypothetical protein
MWGMDINNINIDNVNIDALGGVQIANNMTQGEREEKRKTKLNFYEKTVRDLNIKRDRMKEIEKEEHNIKTKMKILTRKIKKIRKSIRKNIDNALDILVLEGYEKEYNLLNTTYWHDYKFNKYH